MRILGNWAKVECYCVECGKSVSVPVSELPAIYVVCKECKAYEYAENTKECEDDVS